MHHHSMTQMNLISLGAHVTKTTCQAFPTVSKQHTPSKLMLLNLMLLPLFQMFPKSKIALLDAVDAMMQMRNKSRMPKESPTSASTEIIESQKISTIINSAELKRLHSAKATEPLLAFSTTKVDLAMEKFAFLISTLALMTEISALETHLEQDSLVDCCFTEMIPITLQLSYL